MPSRPDLNDDDLDTGFAAEDEFAAPPNLPADDPVDLAVPESPAPTAAAHTSAPGGGRRRCT